MIVATRAPKEAHERLRCQTDPARFHDGQVPSEGRRETVLVVGHRKAVRCLVNYARENPDKSKDIFDAIRCTADVKQWGSRQ